MASSINDDFEIRALLMNEIQSDETNLRNSILSDIYELRDRFGDSVTNSDRAEIERFFRSIFDAINAIDDENLRSRVATIAQRLRTSYLSRINDSNTFESPPRTQPRTNALDMFEPRPSRRRPAFQFQMESDDEDETNPPTMSGFPRFTDDEPEGPPRQGGRKKSKKSKKNKKSRKTRKTKRSRKTRKTKKSRK
jgi:hypothetical protein